MRDVAHPPLPLPWTIVIEASRLREVHAGATLALSYGWALFLDYIGIANLSSLQNFASILLYISDLQINF